jgi:hypothetical protein
MSAKSTMLLEASILFAMDFRRFATPIEVGDMIGADKFLVLKILRRMLSSGLLGQCRNQTVMCERHQADYNLYYRIAA